MMNNIYRSYSYLTRINTSILNANFRNYVTYKSAISLENLYPTSSLKLTSPDKPANKSSTEFSGFIPMDQVDVTYSRSTGPGGQNVNTVNTKVDVRFHIQNATWISDEIKTKLFQKYQTRITKEGYLVFRSELTRSQQLNLADCLQKIRTAIRTASVKNPEPSEETQEKIRRRQERAVQERLMIKRQRSQIKADRRAPDII